MIMKARFSLLILITLTLTLRLSYSFDSEEEEDWNEAGIAWLDDPEWNRVLRIAHEDKKPVFVLIHRRWCGACKALRPKFAGSKDIASLSSDFVMVRSKAEDASSEFNTDQRFSPDGSYFPRILFFDSEGRLLEEVVQRSDKYKYFHHSPESIVEAMKTAYADNQQQQQQHDKIEL